jgi:single-strand DNA-binding protein
MSFSLSKAQIIGNLGADPEMRFTPNGTAVTNFRVAVNRRRRDQEGQQADETDWYRVVCFGRLAEFGDQYLRKGLRVYVDGRLQMNRFVGQDGQERMSPEIIASDVIILSPREGGEGPQGRPPSDEDDLDDLPF